MATWDFWFSDVMVHAPTAPDPLVRQALCRASREFLRRTRIWTEWLEATTTTEGMGVEYDFELPTQTELLRIEQATLNGQPLKVQSFRQRAKDWNQYPDGEKALVSRDLVTYNLTGMFSAGDVVQVQASLIPSLRATGLPDYLANSYLEPIAEGAKAILLLTPGEYFKPDMAGIARALFESYINENSVDAYRSHTNEVPRARTKWC